MNTATREQAEILAMTVWDIISELNSGLFDWAYNDKDKIPLDYVTDAIMEWVSTLHLDYAKPEEGKK